MTKKEAIREFREFILPDVIESYGKHDKIAKAEAWSIFTDSLCREGQITEEQNHSWTNIY